MKHSASQRRPNFPLRSLHPDPHDRRTFLSDVGMGMTGLALGSMLAGEEVAGHEVSPAESHFAPKAKSVIWLFMTGGVSHMESFDPKPALNKYANMNLSQTPLKDVFDAPFVKKNFRPMVDGSLRNFRQQIYPMQIGYRKRGESGIEVSDWWPHVGGCIDDIAVVRSLWTTDNNHGAQLQFHTGRHVSDGLFPSIGSWVHYGLGSLNENLPQFVVMGEPIASTAVQNWHRASYLGAEHDGLVINENKPLPYGNPAGRIFQEEQLANMEMIGKLNQLAAVEYPDDAALRARINAYELAFRMQMSVPEVFDLRDESQGTLDSYGEGYGRQLLTARRLVERGVRFVQVYHGGGGDPAGSWDAHTNLKKNHTKNCQAVDKPIATLLKDLKQRGMLQDTLVVWATEFGRTAGTEEQSGRDHHPFGFSCWLAGGGIRGGVVHGATDELGILASENPHYVTDIHATALHQLGLDSRKLEVPGRKRLEIEFGRPIREIIA